MGPEMEIPHLPCPNKNTGKLWMFIRLHLGSSELTDRKKAWCFLLAL
jgi:hypothetical protein